MASSNGAFPVAPGNNPITQMPSLTTARLLSVQDLDPRNLEPQNLNRQDLEPRDLNQQDRNHGDSREIQETNQVTPSRRSNGQYNPDRLECIQEREHALRTYDLEEGHFKMPVSVADVYNDHVKVKGRMGNLTQVRKLVRSVIFPKMKFVTNEATFSQPAHISEKSVQHDFLVGMNWHENNTDVDKALRWNTYSTDVGKTLSQCRSSSICYMKRNLIPGKCLTLISFRTCYRIY